MKLRSLISKKYLSETYYNKDWSITNIVKWIGEYAADNNLKLTLIRKIKQATPYGGSKKVQAWSIGEYRLIIIDDKAPGAPRLSEVDVIVGEAGATEFSAKNSLRMNGSDGSRIGLFDNLKRIIKTK